MLEVPYFMAIFQYLGAFFFFTWALPILKEIQNDELKERWKNEAITYYFTNTDPWVLPIINPQGYIYYIF